MTVLLVGVDAGGSHTEAAVADQTLTLRARARGAGAGVGPGRIDAAARAIVATVRRALADVGVPDHAQVLVVGAAGAGRDEERSALRAALVEAGLARRVEVTTDAAIALESVFHDAPGILLNAGSGSIAYARDAGGVLWRVGGLGWQLGDEGSGYSMGRAALGAVGRAADGRGPSTALSRLVPERIGVGTLDELVRWAGVAGPGQIAALAEAVQQAARADDPVARQIVEAAAEALADHVLTLVRRFPAGAAVSVALAGGILSEGGPVREALETRLRDRAPQVTLASREVDPPRGALAMAARLRG